METENKITLPFSGAVVEFIPYVTGGILLDIDKQPDISKFLITSMVKQITEKDAEKPVADVHKAVREMHGKDFKAIDIHLKKMLEEAKNDNEAGK